MFINTCASFSPSPLGAYTTPSPTTPLPLIKLTHHNRRRSSIHQLPHTQHHHNHRKTSTCPSAPQLGRTFLTTSPPTKPMNWLWQCHICRRTYALGVTRRCLDDGHYFCSGPTTTSYTSTATRKRGGRSRRARNAHRACASEFDYAGWKVWGQWRRGEIAARRRAAGCADTATSGGGVALAKNCELNCDYPSDCRWGKAFGVSGAVSVPVSPVVVVESAGATAVGAGPATSFEEILGLRVADVETRDGEELERSDELNEFFEKLVRAARGGVESGKEVVRSIFEEDDDDDEQEEEDVQEVDAFWVGEDGHEDLEFMLQ